MLGSGGVDSAIHKDTCSELLAGYRKVKAVDGIRRPFGEAINTEAGNLLTKYVIHAVEPIYRTDNQPEVMLASF